MLRLLFSVCLFLLFNTPGFATLQNGTLSITVNAAPAPGLPAPKIIVLRGFITLYQNNVNWGDTWNLNIPSGTYRILPLPVSDGTNSYVANTVTVFLPPNTVVNKLITYQPA